jgi:hypothetical protein
MMRIVIVTTLIKVILMLVLLTILLITTFSHLSSMKEPVSSGIGRAPEGATEQVASRDDTCP